MIRNQSIENKMTFTQNTVTWNSFEPLEEQYGLKDRGDSIKLEHKQRYFMDSGCFVSHRVGGERPISAHLSSILYNLCQEDRDM